MTDKIDIFEFLKQVDAGNLAHYDTFDDAQKKSLSMVVAAKWLASTNNTTQLVSVNHFVNPFVYKFATNHRELLYRLFLVASSGTGKRYTWAGKKKKVSRKPTTRSVIAEFYGISQKDAEVYINTLSLDETLECAMHLGREDADIKLIKNEFK